MEGKGKKEETTKKKLLIYCLETIFRELRLVAFVPDPLCKDDRLTNNWKIEIVPYLGAEELFAWHPV